jgi:probable addiction module antidote protein
MGIGTKPFDVAEHLDSPEMLAAYLEAVLEEGDSSLLPKALGDVARAIGMANIAFWLRHSSAGALQGLR